MALVHLHHERDWAQIENALSKVRAKQPHPEPWTELDVYEALMFGDANAWTLTEFPGSVFVTRIMTYQFEEEPTIMFWAAYNRYHQQTAKFLEMMVESMKPHAREHGATKCKMYVQRKGYDRIYKQLPPNGWELDYVTYIWKKTYDDINKDYVIELPVEENE